MRRAIINNFAHNTSTDRMDYVVKLEGVKRGTPGVGRKAEIVGELYNSNMAVPNGFVMTSESFSKFLKANRIAQKIEEALRSMNFSDYQSLKERSVEMQAMITNGTVPDYIEHAVKEEYEELSIGREAKEVGGIALDLIKAGRGQSFVAVRSSPLSDTPHAAFSGQMKSLTNVQGHSSICDAMKECWASLFTPRALLYRKARRIEGFPMMGVLVQKMVESDKSGWLFTNQPETGDSSGMVIESSFGLGEAISSGMVTPDEFILEKDSGKILSSRVRKKNWMIRRDAMSGKSIKETVPREKTERPSLDEEDIKKLWNTGMKLERHFSGHAQEVEWSIERGRVMVLQSTPSPGYGQTKEMEALGGEKLASGTAAFHGSVKGNARVIISMSELHDFSRGEIIVTRMTDSDMARFIRDAGGVITDEGGRVCHAARLCREVGIPCIVGCGNATSSIEDRSEIILDTSQGSVYPVPAPVPEPVQPSIQVPSIAQVPQMPPSPPGFQPLPEVPMEGQQGVTATGIKAIMSFPERVNEAVGKCDGVGIVKPEYMIADRGKHSIWLSKNDPEELIKILVDGMRTIARSFYPNPVWYRAIDIRTDEFRDLDGGEDEPTENNPLLGWHGIRRSLDEQEILKCEVEALIRLREEGLDNIMVAIPFVSRAEEIRRVRNGIKDLPIRIGIMIETPAAALDIENLCREGISFVCIGIDELTQLSVGADKDNPRTSRIFSEMNPGVMSLVNHVVSVCRKNHVETSAYGSIENNHPLIERLVAMGINSITSEPDYLDSLKEVISRSERKLLLERARDQSFYPPPM
jgi:pyruvate,water dikinase